MKNYLLIAKQIQSDLEGNHLQILEEHNLKINFAPIYRMEQHPIETLNSIVAYILLAYSNGSQWLDLNQDRLQNKTKIIEGLGIKINPFFKEIIDCENKVVNMVIYEHLQDQASWEFQQAATYLDNHQTLIRLVNENVETGFTTEEQNKDGNVVKLTTQYSADQITSAHEKRAKLLSVAHENRIKAGELIAKLKGEFVQLDNAVQGDFGFSITDEKTIDPESWRHFMKRDYLPRKKPMAV